MLKGEARIRSGDRILAHIKPVTCFGELTVAASRGRTATVEVPEGKGAEVVEIDWGITEQDNDGHTPLHEAARWDQQKMAKLFLVHGANVNAKGSDGRGPLHIAIANGNTDIANLLKRHGAKL